MTIGTQQAKILAAIQSRGWFTMDIYNKAAEALSIAGKIKVGSRYTTGGTCKIVWVGA